ncbi:MAG: hypothetical protein M3R63_12845 [Actinomycetota bacterium]|nr:hypothetical protein [Actinomycetota bacterium]
MEVDTTAAHHALHRRFPSTDVVWCVLATDGAQRVIDHLDIPWADVARMPETELAALLDELHRWESDSDPNGALLPRAKCHDDKTLVTWSPG